MGLRKKFLVLLGTTLVSCCFFWLFVMPARSGYITVSTEQGGWIPNCQSWVNSGIPIASTPDNVVITSINVWFGGMHFSESDLVIDLKDGNSSRNVRLWNREGFSMYYGGDLSYSKLVTGITTFNGMPVNGTWRLWANDYSCYCPPDWPCPSAEGPVPAWEMTAFYEVDSDGDGVPDNIDADDDSDGMPDVWETTYGLDPHTNDAYGDKDGDGLTNLEEYQIGTRPDLTDTDGDGMPDKWEFVNRLWPTDPLDAVWELDGDTLTSLQEFQLGTDPNKADTDGDGMPDGWELQYVFDPLDSTDAALDADNDGLSNLQEYLNHTLPDNPDSDADGLSDGWEVQYGFNPLSQPNLPPEMQDGATDYDHDGLIALDEFDLGTNPNNSDTDGDGMPDGWEAQYGLNPLIQGASLDQDGDCRSNIVEYQQGTNPTVPDGTFTLTATASISGTITPTSVLVDYGGSQTFTMTPATGYHVVNVLVDGVSQGAVSSYAFSNVTAAHTISASFALNTYAITTSAGSNGSISPTSPTVNYGGSQTFTITPATDYYVADVVVDGVSQGTVSSYIFSNVTASHTISATFTKLPTAIFTTSLPSSSSPATATFTNSSTNATSWLWNFGDGTTSTLQNPTHVFKNPGTYTVRLTATNVAGSTTTTQNITLTACATQPVKIGSSYYATLQAAYDAAATGALIQVLATGLTESLLATRDISVTIDGGYLCGFPANPPDITTITGAPRISGGSVKMKNLRIKQ